MGVLVDFSTVSVGRVKVSRSMRKEFLPVLAEFFGKVPNVRVSGAFHPGNGQIVWRWRGKVSFCWFLDFFGIFRSFWAIFWSFLVLFWRLLAFLFIFSLSGYSPNNFQPTSTSSKFYFVYFETSLTFIKPNFRHFSLFPNYFVDVVGGLSQEVAETAT